MNTRSRLFGTIVLIGLAVVVITAYQNYDYIHLLVTHAPKFPTRGPADNREIYQIDPEKILASLDQGTTGVFTIAQKNPIYDDVPVLKPHSSFPWNQPQSLAVANAFHRFIWKESLDKWHLYSAGFTIPQCNDISRISSAGFQFYQRHKNWYYLFHNVDINLEYGYIYASDNNGHYTGQWKDLDLETVTVDSFDKALLIAEQNGGDETRANVKGNEKCHISVYFSPHPLFDKSWSTWAWEITYWDDTDSSLLFGIIIDPATGSFEKIK